jgi:hypothetical protein
VADVRGPVGDDDLEKWESSAQTPEDHRAAAATLVAWADEPHPDDDVPPARLLSSAAWHLETAGDAEQALDLHRRAVEAPGEVSPTLAATCTARCSRPGTWTRPGSSPTTSAGRPRPTPTSIW